MEVHEGWATEFARKKFDVVVEDQDFPLILAEVGLDGLAADITVTEKFWLMKLTAQWYSAVEYSRLPEVSGNRVDYEVRASAISLQRTEYAVGILARIRPCVPEHPYEAASEPAAV